MLVTEDAIIEAYRALYLATSTACEAARRATLAEITLKEAETQIWPGTNETERKANMRLATASQRVAWLAAEDVKVATQNEVALAALRVEEQKTLLRFYEVSAVTA